MLFCISDHESNSNFSYVMFCYSSIKLNIGHVAYHIFKCYIKLIENFNVTELLCFIKYSFNKSRWFRFLCNWPKQSIVFRLLWWSTIVFWLSYSRIQLSAMIIHIIYTLLYNLWHEIMPLGVFLNEAEFSSQKTSYYLNHLTLKIPEQILIQTAH